MKRLVIVGGGISGLAAATGARDAARASGLPLEIDVMERDERVGGKALTLREDGYLVEGGPSGFLAGDPALDRLVAAAGLEQDVCAASRDAAQRFIFHAGKMRGVSANPVAFACSGLLGPLGMLRVACEPFVPRKRAKKDESVHGFAARRIGTQAAERLIGPMVLGVFAGDARAISLPSAFPKMAAMEAEHGGLVRAMLARRRRPANGPPRGGPAGPAGLTSFREGLQSLPERLASRGDFNVRTRAPVSSLARSRASWTLRIADASIVADAVVLSVEPWCMADLVRPLVPEMADELDAIPCPAVSVVALGYGPEARARARRGFGVLVARGEGLRLLGCLFDTFVFPERSPANGLLVRAMYGGAVDEQAGALDSEELITLARREIETLLGITEIPRLAKAIRWPRAIPQYLLGHGDRLARIEASLTTLPGLHLAGNGLYGVAFAKAAAHGYATGRRVASELLPGSP